MADTTGDTSTSDSRDDSSLDGRVAVISGASSAMADAIADGLARAGAKLVLGDIATGPMELTSERLRDAGHDVLSEPVDVTRSADVDALVALARTRFDRIDVMINMAGVIHDAKVIDTTEADLDRVLSVNLKGVYFGCQAAARAMLEQGSGSIVNMASSAGFTPIPMLSGYSMSKAGIVALTRVLAAEVGRKGIRVNAVAPGFVEGGMTVRHLRRPDGSLDPAKVEEGKQMASRRNPLGTTGTGRDIANAVCFLASDASRYITGQVIHANGGAYMP